MSNTEENIVKAVVATVLPYKEGEGHILRLRTEEGVDVKFHLDSMGIGMLGLTINLALPHLQSVAPQDLYLHNREAREAS